MFTGDREIGLAPVLAQACFTWGSANLVAIAEIRRAYVAALQPADRGDIGPLMAFARSLSSSAAGIGRTRRSSRRVGGNKKRTFY